MTGLELAPASALRRAVRVLRDKRGTVASVLAVGATATIGMLALAAEGGLWQLQARAARTAADLGALAGAAAIDRGANAVSVARSAVSGNGFAQGGDSGRTSVAVNSPPTAGTYAGRTDAVEVIVMQNQTLRLAAMVLGTAPQVRARAVAVSSIDVSVCILALNGGLGLGGNSTTNAQRCALGSNSTANGINVFGSATVRASDLVTTGGCSGCTSGNVWTDDTRTARPDVNANRPEPIPDPYKSLQNWNPTSSMPACRATAVPLDGTAVAPGQAICSDVKVGPKNTLTLSPGIHYFNNASLDVKGTLTSTGGVTLVFTGATPSNVGIITVNAGATVDLTGPSSSLVPGVSAGKGVLIYRDARATNNGPQNEVKLNGGASMRLFGGIYLPTSDVQVNGNSGTSYSTCMPIVGYALSFSGTADTRVDVSGCSNFMSVPQIRTPRLVE